MSEKLNFEETLAVLNGEDLEEYRKEKALRVQINEELPLYINTERSNWPAIKFNWDLSVSSQRFSLDGSTQAEFNKNYPEGFLLGFVGLKELDAILCHHSRRDDGELWELGCSHKLAFLIVYLSKGHPISPPLVKPLESGEIIFHGGHHRYAIAKELGELIVPIHAEPKFKGEIDSLLNVNWKNA